MTFRPEDLKWQGEAPDRQPDKGKWYGVTDMSFLYAVAGTSPEQALTALEEYNIKELGLRGLMMPMIHEHDSETQEALRLRYGERLAVMLIPFSIVEYPLDGAVWTDEQREAFEQLRGSDQEA